MKSGGRSLLPLPAPLVFFLKQRRVFSVPFLFEWRNQFEHRAKLPRVARKITQLTIIVVTRASATLAEDNDAET